MKNENNYTGLKVGLIQSEPISNGATSVNLLINGFLIRTVSLLGENPKTKNLYEKSVIDLNLFFEEIKREIEKELKENHPEREIIFDDDFVWTGKPSAHWGGDNNSYKGINYYFSQPSPSSKGDPLLLIWTFRTEKGNTQEN